MSFLNSIPGPSDISNALQGGINSLNQTVYGTNTTNGPVAPMADGQGLPSSHVASQRQAIRQRDVAHWYVPEVGIINMFINPQSISYDNKKIINRQLTKGGFMVQYWGEDLTTLRIHGHTGSSGFEGINVLYEIYRAEQYLFDPLALTMAADSSITGLNSIINSTLGNLGSFGNSIANATLGVLGLDPATQNIAPSTIPSLASIALGIELYYAGLIFHGYFESFSVNESVDPLGIFTYDIAFVVTQRRGYRINGFPWQVSAISGPSNHNNIPLSWAGLSTTPNGAQSGQ